PVAPSEHAPDVPRELERLILQLLAKQAQDRPTSAAAVAALLGELADAPAAPVAPAVDPPAATQARRCRSVRVPSADVGDPAQRGEILLGERLSRVISADASVDSATGRLLELRVEQPALLRVSRTPFVGRARELEQLREAFGQARDASSCVLVTVSGAPGIGK